MNEVALREYLETLIRKERELTEARFLSLDRAIAKTYEDQALRNETFNHVRRQIEEERTAYVRKDWLEGQLRFLLMLMTFLSGLVMFTINFFFK